MGIQIVQSNDKEGDFSRDVTFVEDEEWQWNATTEMD